MCSSGCPTGTCTSYAACLRGKGAVVAGANSATGSDATRQRQSDRELARYRDLVKSGVQPPGTAHKDMDRAERLAEVGRHEPVTVPLGG